MMQASTGGFRLTLALGLVGMVLMFVPAEAVRPVRAWVRDALRPGQAALQAAFRETRTRLASWRAPVGHDEESQDRAAEIAALRLANRRLELQIALLRERVQKLSEQQGLTPSEQSPTPLIIPRVVEARVLGEETAALWRGRKMLSVGTAQEIAESALVLDDTRPLIDAGSDVGLAPGDGAYAGRIVIGK